MAQRYRRFIPDIVKHKAGLITEAAQRLRMSVDRALVRDIAAEIEWAKVSLFTPDTLTPHLHQRNLPSGITPQNMVRLFRAYEDLKDERNLIDFEDVLLLTVGIIEDDDALAATIREQYRHFVVDEYQDVSPLQQRLLDAWLGSATIYASWAMPRRPYTRLPAPPVGTSWNFRDGTGVHTQYGSPETTARTAKWSNWQTDS